MININLLPQEIKSNIKHAKQNANIFSICLVIILVLCLICLIIYKLQKNYYTPQLEDLQAQVSAADNALKPYQQFEKQALFINDRSQLAKSVENKRAIWSIIYQELINSVPSDTQFTDLTIDTSKKPNIVLQGKTTSEREAIKFRDKLESSPYFKDVAFKSSSTSQGTDASNQSLTFTLEFNLEKYGPNATITSGSSQ